LLCREGVSNMELKASKLILSRPFSSDSGVLLTGLYEFPSFVYRTSLFSMSVLWCVIYWWRRNAWILVHTGFLNTFDFIIVNFHHLSRMLAFYLLSHLALMLLIYKECSLKLFSYIFIMGKHN
jgi:hypothetical protein